MPEQFGPDHRGHDAHTHLSKRPDAAWREAIDVCRPASDDLSLPELAELAAEIERNPLVAQEYHRVQQLDAALVEAVGDVPVPDGLQERLLAGVRSASAGESLPLSPAVMPAAIAAGQTGGSEAGIPGASQAFDAPAVGAAAPDAAIMPPSAAPAARTSWFVGGWITAGGVLAAAACVALMLYVFRPAPSEIDADEIVELALQEHEKLHDGMDTATSPQVDVEDQEYPFSRAVRKFRGAKVLKIDDFLGRSGVVYQMTAPNGTRASLYVVELAGPRSARVSPGSLPTAPLASRTLNTGGLTAAAWEESKLLYVLVVEGGEAAFGQFVPPPGRVASRKTSLPACFAGNRAGIRTGDAFRKVSLI